MIGILRRDEIRILLLNPNSPEAKRIARGVDMEENERIVNLAYCSKNLKKPLLKKSVF
jgi:hypothetical protein